MLAYQSVFINCLFLCSFSYVKRHIASFLWQPLGLNSGLSDLMEGTPPLWICFIFYKPYRSVNFKQLQLLKTYSWNAAHIQDIMMANNIFVTNPINTLTIKNIK